MQPEEISIPVGDERVSGLLLRPPAAKALFLFSHGAGAGMMHESMAQNAQGLAERGIATLRYQFLYMEKGSKRPDAPALAHKVVRAAAAQARLLASDLPLFAGGRSFGGRMTSQTQADTSLEGVQALVFLGFPLHPAGKPGIERAAHLATIDIPMLFVSGSRDPLSDLDLLKPVVADLAARATLCVIDHADHGFKAPAKSGRSAEGMQNEVLDALAGWILNIAVRL